MFKGALPTSNIAKAERLFPDEVELGEQVEAHERRALVEVAVAVVVIRIA
jgi:hypothetical protein